MSRGGKAALSPPVRGTPGGWRDRWDDPDATAAVRAAAERAERRLLARAARLGATWRQELAERGRR